MKIYIDGDNFHYIADVVKFAKIYNIDCVIVHN